MALLLLATFLIGFGMKDGIEFFKSPTQIYELMPKKSQVIRLGGLVEENSLSRGEGEEIRFNVTDRNMSITVLYNGILPDLFKENQGVIALGSLREDGTFKATEILAKHDEEYLPKEIAETLKDDGLYVQSQE